MHLRSRAPVPSRADGTARRDPRGVAAVAAAALLAGAVIWAPVMMGDDDDAAIGGSAVPLAGGLPGAGEVAVAGGTISTIASMSRRLQSFPVEAMASTGPGRVVGADGDLAVAVAAPGPASGAVWVAVRRSGGGLLVRVGEGGAVSRVISTGELAPRRIAALPGWVFAVGDNRIAGVPMGAGTPWSRALPSAVDVGVGYRSVWTLSRLLGARSLVARRDPATGRITGRRILSAGATRLAVGLGAVWVANGCENGVLRAPVGGGAGVCVRVGKGPADVTVGGGRAWAADASAGRIVEMDGATAKIVRRWAVDGRPAAVAASGDVVAVVTRGGRAFALAAGERPRADSGGSR